MNYEKLPIESVELDINNPRIKQWLEIYNEITSEDIALALCAPSSGDTSSSYNALKESIKVNGGIINPIIVNRYDDGRLVVIEGNTRLQIYKEFAEKDPDGPWKEIIAIVYDNLPESDIHAIRLQSHLVGPRDWDPFSKAKYLNQLSNIDRMPMSTIISFCGGKDAEIRKLIDAYNDMVEFYFPVVEALAEDPDPRDFSKFSELQNRSVFESLKIHHFDKKDFAEWVVKGNIDNALNVRKLPSVLSNKESREVFLKSNISEALKYVGVPTKSSKDLEHATINELVVELIKRFRNVEHRYVKSLKNDPKYEDEKNDIFILQGQVNEIIEDIEEY